MRTFLGLLLLTAAPAWARGDDLADRLRKLDPRVIPADEAAKLELDRMVARDVRERIHAAHRQLAEEWEKVRTLDDWRRFRDPRIAALRRSLGIPPLSEKFAARTVGTIEAGEYRIDKLVVEARPGYPITANLYRPAKPTASMPALIVLHSFFHPKSQPELQDLGVNGARAGCLVLVPDVVGHGERRQHPFVDAAAHPEKFNIPRQDYFSRAPVGLQLDLAGSSLMGWMVADVMRCVDVLHARPDVDRKKIVVLGAVAAGGDIAGVAAALDERISGVVPYNFGGPEPETPYPLPPEGELSFPYASGGHWDSTRRLRNSARDGFLPWVVLGAVAPRRLIYAHEFAWDREHDSAWKRLEKIYELHETRGNLTAAFGEGTLFGKPEGTGCGNIGAYHRRTLAPALKKWFGIVWPEKEVQERRTEAELRCLTPKLIEELKPRPLFAWALQHGNERLDAARKTLAALPEEKRIRQLRDDWERILGPTGSLGRWTVTHDIAEKHEGLTVYRIILRHEENIVVPFLLLMPRERAKGRPVVVAVSRQGKQGFLEHRSADIAALIGAGMVVCLPDVRGTGETCPAGDKRGRPSGSMAEMRKSSEAVLLANEELMLGRTLLAGQLRDLSAVLWYLRGRSDLDNRRLAVWGDSFAPVNPPDARLIVPPDVPTYPHRAEPLGAMLALLCGVFEENVEAIYARGGLTSFRSPERSPILHVPADTLAPGMLTIGDISDRRRQKLLIVGSVDALNRAEDKPPADGDAAKWLKEKLGR